MLSHMDLERAVTLLRFARPRKKNRRLLAGGFFVLDFEL